MDYLFTGEQIRRKVIRFGLWVLIMWILYVMYHFFSEYVREQKEESDFWNTNAVRFALREIVVYTFGFMGYFFLKRETLHPNFRLQFWLLLAFFDLICLSIGLYRQFVGEHTVLHDMYNRIIEIIASPVYVIVFVAYALYFSVKTNHEKQI